MSIKQSQLLDLIATTLNDLPKQEFEVGWDNQDYEFCRIYQTERMVIDGGTQIERKVMLDESGNAHYRRVYDTDNPQVNQVMHTIKVPWALIGTNYSWDEFEILQQKNSAKGFINLMKVRRTDGLWSLANLIEERAWKTPTSATDDLYPYGVPYYLNVKTVANAVNASFGFVGGTVTYQDATYGTVCANIDAATEAKWRNYAAVYTAVDNAMLKSFRLAFMYTNFKAPLFVNDPANKRQAAKRVYTDFDTVAQLMNLADQRDDNHTGKDVLGNLRVDDSGLVSLNRLPVVGIPQLNGASYTPMYCVDFAKFVPVVHDGYWMEEKEPMVSRGQHTTYTVYLDGAHNNLCLNRRTCGFVLHKAS
jgi:hypothetical protein